MDVIENIQVPARRFELDPEIAARLLKRWPKFVPLLMTFYGWEKAEGKKLSWQTGIAALWRLVKHRVVN